MLRSSRNGFIPQNSTKNLGFTPGGGGGSGGGSYTVATLPDATENAGAVVYLSDGNLGNPCAAISDGTRWEVLKIEYPVSENTFLETFNGSSLEGFWSWLNQGDATVSVSGGDCSISSIDNTGPAQPVRGFYRMFDGSGDFSVVCQLTRDAVSDGVSNLFCLAGVFLRDSVTQKIEALTVGWGDGYRAIVWKHSGDGATYDSYVDYTATNYGSAYLRIVASGSTLTFSVSTDNANWAAIATQAKYDYLSTIDSIGFGIINSNTAGGGSTATQVFHYIQTYAS